MRLYHDGLAERIVLFHDRMPQGRRDAELLGKGLGLIDGHLFFPDPERRFQSTDEYMNIAGEIEKINLIKNIP